MRQGVVIHHNGPNVGIRDGDSHSKCEAYWNGVKRYHVETKGWSDIAYSFGVCVHGRRFVGRGWDKAQFANGSDVVGVDDGKDSEWYTVLVFLGWNADAANPVDEEPSRAMVDGVRDLISEGRDAARCGTRVLPHNAFKQKRCPGATFTELAGQWDHAPLNEPPEDDMTPEDRALLENTNELARWALQSLEGNDTALAAAGRRPSIRTLLKELAQDPDVSDPAGSPDLDELIALVKALPANTVTALKNAL